MIEFENFCRALGLLPKEVVADGRWRRCRTETHMHHKNGTYKLAADGLIGWAQDHAAHVEPSVWRPESGGPAPRTIDVQALERRRAAERAAMRAATQAARSYYAACAPLMQSHPYLAGKHLDMTGCRGLRLDAKGWIVVPMMVNGEISSIQRISPTGEKLFWPGAPTRNTTYLINRHTATLTVLCEGLSTGLAIFAAVPTCRVTVAFNAANLPRVAEQMQITGMTVVAADNDHETAKRLGHNPGVVAAREAAERLACGVAVPDVVQGSDWLDYRLERLKAREEKAAMTLRQRVRPADMARAVDAEIAGALMREARFLRR